MNDETPKKPPFADLVMAASNALHSVVTTWGPSGGVLAVLAGMMSIASDATQDEFVRDVLWGEKTGVWRFVVGVIMFDLLVLSRVGAAYRRWAKGEMDRIASERSSLQAMLLERDVNHTAKRDQ